MAVVIIHYHLSAGGVTRVIEETSRSLGRAGVDHVVLTGSASACTFPPCRVIEGLGYCSEDEGPTAMELVSRMRAAVLEVIGNGPHVWHFHNPSLGVNVRMAEIVTILAEEGERLLLQLHDLAEDGRPSNYPLLDRFEPYPHAPQIRYAFLNSRDRDRFSAAGLPKDRSVVLPNPVRVPDHPVCPSGTSTLVLYPVRGIRRKNLGEVFLLAAISPPGTRYATTLTPSQKRWRPYFETWQAFARSSGLPVELAVVDRLNTDNGASTFEAWQAEATHILTTSVAEGFGLAFLEAIAIGKPLFGRDLPAIKPDHAAQGITTGQLYDHLLIPAAWLDRDALRQALSRCLQDLCEAYGRDLSGSYLEEVAKALEFGDLLDFGNLPENLQQAAIQHLLNGADASEVLVELDGERVPAPRWLEGVLAQRSPSASVDQLSPYSPEACRTRLIALYDQLLAATPQRPEFLPKRSVLEQYFRPANFHFLLT